MYPIKTFTSDDKFVRPDRIVCLAKTSKEQDGSGSEATPLGLFLVGRKFIVGDLIEYCNPWDLLSGGIILKTPVPAFGSQKSRIPCLR